MRIRTVDTVDTVDVGAARRSHKTVALILRVKQFKWGYLWKRHIKKISIVAAIFRFRVETRVKEKRQAKYNARRRHLNACLYYFNSRRIDFNLQFAVAIYNYVGGECKKPFYSFFFTSQYGKEWKRKKRFLSCFRVVMKNLLHL